MAAACLGRRRSATSSCSTKPVYAAAEAEARARSLREATQAGPSSPAPWSCRPAIWTNDDDFLGTGVATWTTESLDSTRRPPPGHLTRRPDGYMTGLVLTDNTNISWLRT